MFKNIIITELEKKNILDLYGVANNLILNENIAAKIRSALSSTQFQSTITNTLNSILKSPKISNIAIDVNENYKLNDNFELNYIVKGSIPPQQVIKIGPASSPDAMYATFQLNLIISDFTVNVVWLGMNVSYLPTVGPKSIGKQILSNLSIKLPITLSLSAEESVTSYILKLKPVLNAFHSSEKKSIPATYWTIWWKNSILYINFGTVFGYELGTYSLFDLNPYINSIITESQKIFIEIPKNDFNNIVSGKLKTADIDFSKYIKGVQVLTPKSHPKTPAVRKAIK